MAANVVREVRVWLDGLAPGQGTFAHALEWASIMQLPLRGLEIASRKHPPLPAHIVADCQAACAWQGVAWSHSHANPEHSLDLGGDGGTASDLLVLGGDMPQTLQRRLIRDSVLRSRLGPLVCPRSWDNIRRALIVNGAYTSDRGFLETAARICRAAACPATVLTQARFDEHARARQQLADEIFAAQGVAADYHVAVGSDFLTGVSVVANWRRCSHVFLEKVAVYPVRRWLGRGVIDHILELSDTLTILAIPASGFHVPAASQRVDTLTASDPTIVAARS